MFIKLPSGQIIQIEKIVRVSWSVDQENILHVFTVEDNQSLWLKDADAKRLYEYLESAAFE